MNPSDPSGGLDLYYPTGATCGLDKYSFTVRFLCSSAADAGVVRVDEATECNYRATFNHPAACPLQCVSTSVTSAVVNNPFSTASEINNNNSNTETETETAETAQKNSVKSAFARGLTSGDGPCGGNGICSYDTDLKASRCFCHDRWHGPRCVSQSASADVYNVGGGTSCDGTCAALAVVFVFLAILLVGVGYLLWRVRRMAMLQIQYQSGFTDPSEYSRAGEAAAAAAAAEAANGTGSFARG